MHGGEQRPRTNGKAPIKGAEGGLFRCTKVLAVWHIWLLQQPGWRVTLMLFQAVKIGGAAYPGQSST